MRAASVYFIFGNNPYLYVDSTDNNKLLQRLLYLRNVSSDVAESGLRALEVLTSYFDCYDFIFMDNDMPEQVRAVTQLVPWCDVC